jgi:tetratricopeptide (TPR) repeat protein
MKYFDFFFLNQCCDFSTAIHRCVLTKRKTVLPSSYLTSRPRHEKIAPLMLRLCSLLTLVYSLFVINAVAQVGFYNPQLPQPGAPAYGGPGAGAVGSVLSGVSTRGVEGGASIVVSVFDDVDTHLDRQAAVKLYDEARKVAIWQATEDTSSATTFGDLAFGKYELEISAVGYLTAHKEIQLDSVLRPAQVQIILRRDPAAVELTAADAALPAKASKETRRGIADLKSGKLKDAQKQLDAAYKIVPSNAQVNFLLGYVSFQQSNFAQAQTYLSKASTLDPHNIQALDLLGRLYLLRKDYAAAQTILEQAVATDPENWMAHNLLGDVYLNQHDYNNAVVQSDLAIEQGKRAAGSSQIVRGEALADLGRDKEAIQALQAFLQSEPESPSAQQAHQLISTIEQRASKAQPVSVQPATKSEASGADPVLAAGVPGLSLKGWAPPGVDDTRPPVAAGVACPYQDVIEKSGERVKQLVDNVARFSAIEDLLHERLDNAGNPITRETRKFDYVVAISQRKSGLLSVDEFRSGRYGVSDLPDQIVTNGLPTLALVFHPDMRDDFQMTCEGLGSLHGQATWLIHFRQREDRPMRVQSYLVGTEVYPVELKGRAWISADNFQILRVESELDKAIPRIQLRSEHQIAEYGPVKFNGKDVELWLPKSAELYLDFGHHLYYRRHSFDHFMLFSVDSTDAVHEATGKHGPGSTFPRKRKKWHA